VTKVRKAVITAAGRGTRHYPASKAVQKELFPLVDRDGVTKPMIQIIAEEAIGSGIEEICIVTPPGGAVVYQNYFDAPGRDEALARIGKRLHFAEQPSPEGFGHAVYQARRFAGHEPFLLLLGDHVHISTVRRRCARQLIGVHEARSPDAVSAVQLEQEQSLHLFGTIKGEAVDPPSGVYLALKIVEKPSIAVAREQLTTPGLPPATYLAHFGMHVFPPRIFDVLEHLIKDNRRENGEIQLTAAQEHLRRESSNYLVAVVQGIRCDAGIPSGLLQTQIALALHGAHASIARAAIGLAGPGIELSRPRR
jgi:UTP--glucose-1-phosphate uridylyltransferase